LSSSSLKDANADNTGEDWLPVSLNVRDKKLFKQDSYKKPKQLLKPPGQLQLNEKELDEELTRILNANNPHAAQNFSRYSHKEKTFKTVANMEHHTFHFEFDG
jgi:hypothetical protein